MKVYILMGIFKDSVESYAATLDASLKDKMLEDHQHDYPMSHFQWEEQELQENK